MMFIVSLTYIAPLDQIDAALPEHIAFLERQYSAGIFLASGRKVPRTGGIILAQCSDEQRLRAILSEDPFAKKELATFEIQEFAASKVQSGLEMLLAR